MARVERGDELGTMDRAVVRSRGGPLHVRTPLIISKPMSEVLGRDVYLKLDALQPSGSFKLRGIGYTCQKAIAEGANALVSSSGGNAGLATAYAGQRARLGETVGLSLHDLWSFHDPEGEALRARAMADA